MMRGAGVDQEWINQKRVGGLVVPHFQTSETIVVGGLEIQTTVIEVHLGGERII